MGQTVTGLMLGVRPSTDLIQKLVDPLDDYSDYLWTLEYKDAPEEDEQSQCFGYIYAVSASPETGEVLLGEEAIPLAQIEKVFPKQLKRAQSRWTKLAAWVKEHCQVDLPAPEIYLVSVERA